ncbi:MAG TPA: hypothetical protein VM764_01715 [Gemmatimonadaceae bacterium]|jgi:hypothetical protein|nr:hypothetical protein [Gemmatimonadaceae bacterium]
MTANTPFSGRDTAAAFRGLIVGAAAVLAIVLTIVFLVNQKYAGIAAAAESTTESTH